MSETLLLSNCPCGSQKKFTDCCEPLISGKQPAASPEALMRSRYTSFTLQDVDYLFRSMTPELQQETDREDMQDFADEVDSWVKLEVINAPVIAPDATEGNVEFAAYFMYEGEQQRIHENSQFVKKDGQWFYAGHEHQCSSHDHDDDDDQPHDDHPPHVHDEHCGHHHHHEPYKADIKIGRNDPCPCGSGKKYKKCCIE